MGSLTEANEENEGFCCAPDAILQILSPVSIFFFLTVLLFLVHYGRRRI
jgi:hypothetical protein